MNNSVFIEILDTLIFEHPETVMQAFMYVLVTRLDAPESKTPNDLEKYRVYKLHAFRDLLQYMQEAIDREKCRHFRDDLGKRLYPRNSFPVEREVPIYHRERAKELGDVILAYIQPLDSDDALRFYSELITTWFFACPEILLRMTPHYLT
jgi:hypothetical protein